MIKEIHAVYTDAWLNDHIDIKAKEYTWRYGTEPDAATAALGKAFEMLAVMIHGGLEGLRFSC